MTISKPQQTIYWGVASITFLGLFWLLNDILLPFILAAAIAYILDPIADKLEASGLNRIFAVIVVLVISIVILLPTVIVVSNVILHQLSEIMSLNFSEQQISVIESRLLKILPTSLGERLDLDRSFDEIAKLIRPRAEDLFEIFGQSLISAIVTSATSLINILFLVLLVPVVTVYLLLDWDKMISRIDTLLPRDHAVTIRRLAKEIDDTLSAFVRGMGSVCLILGIYYAVSLWMIGLNLGFVVGIFAGLITFIPYLGTIIGASLAMGLGLFEFWGEWNRLALVAIIFLIGQVVEGNYLTPKLVGGSIGLHPVWILLALSIFGAFFGFAGMLIAIPAAACMGVLVRFAAYKYTSGSLYRGSMDKNDRF